ncbi:hypothetical protein BHE74_00023095 [Ensete ventricosum]|nr:hypothetical protein BHE74_00023095 [Ensete ventricosum]
MASVDLIGAKLEAFETRMEDKLCALFVEFRLGRSPSPRRSQRGESFDRKENPPEKEEQATDSSYLRRVSGLVNRFRLTEYEYTNDQLVKIRQTSNVQEYQTRFEHLSNQTQDWSEKQLLRMFIEGLKSEIRCEVKVRQSYTLRVVISFACIHEERLNNDAQRTKIMNRPATIKPSASPVANRTSQPKELPKNSEKDRRKGYVGTATNRGVEIIATKGGSFW